MIEQVNGEVVLNVWTVLSIILSSALVGGAVGVAVVGATARNILNNEAGIKAVEGLAKSVPAEVAARIIEIANNARPVIDLVEEAFDGIPAEEKPQV